MMTFKGIEGYNPIRKEREREARAKAEIEARAGNIQPK